VVAGGLMVGALVVGAAMARADVTADPDGFIAAITRDGWRGTNVSDAVRYGFITVQRHPRRARQE
jgi:hypothetical protein